VRPTDFLKREHAYRTSQSPRTEGEVDTLRGGIRAYNY
jgi:hypothetical protein